MIFLVVRRNCKDTYKWCCWGSNPDHSVRPNNFRIFLGWTELVDN